MLKYVEFYEYAYPRDNTSIFARKKNRIRFTMKRHVVILILIAVILSAGMVYVFLHYNLIPHIASLELESINNMLKILFSIAAVFFTIIAVFFLDSIIFYRRRRGDVSDGLPIRGHSTIEIVWTIIPLIIVIVLGIYGAVVLNDITKTGPPSTELQVDVTASRFAWQFSYPSYNITSFSLNLPVDREVIFHIQSKDVVHSFWVTEFGPKQDAVPGLTTELRLTPDKIGQYQVRCSQLCGPGHTYMTAPVYVTSSADFQTWVRQQQQASANATPAAATPLPTEMPTATINLTAQNMAFNMSTITVAMGTDLTINFDNQDQVPHNFSLYTDSSAKTVIFRGQIVSGPGKATYSFMAPMQPGTYFFRCDVHPEMMTDSFIVK